MKTTTKQALITTGWFTILIAVIGGTLLWQRQVRQPKHPVNAVTITSTNRVPTVLLLGHNVSQTNSRQLVAGLQQNDGSQSTIQIQVTKTGHVTFHGQLQPHDNRPYLQLNLPTGTATQQAHWMTTVITTAKQQLAFKHYNLLAYGDGGLTATNYLAHTTAGLSPLNFVAIATPFNGTSRKQNNDTATAVHVTKQTTRLKRLISQRKSIHSAINVTLIAGNAKGIKHGDGVVPVQSALAGQAIFKNQVNRYQHRILHTWRASHARLFSSWRLANLIQDSIN
ncbi:alpha/beta hydrolase [Lactiplantibacillus dongliensis]|uniref:Alpha/beta hydrolase n=1 Tax=Lactiplantibacillus dongliensis TaxID=2559919 RepID=A0ABW1R5C1_9LACO|nr:alpha/beta hydrolase [Lactiplantibacillus dongliensis]